MKQKYSLWEDCKKLPELKSLKKFNHRNIIKLKEVVLVKEDLSFVFEFIEKNVFELYDEQKQEGKPLPEETIRNIFF